MSAGKFWSRVFLEVLDHPFEVIALGPTESLKSGLIFAEQGPRFASKNVLVDIYNWARYPSGYPTGA